MNQKFLILAITLLITLILAGGVWYWQSNHVLAPITSNNDNLQDIQTESIPEPSLYPQHIEAIPRNADEVWYQIPELGIRMRLNREFAEDLVYVSSNENGIKEIQADTIYFTSRVLYSLAPNCAFGSIGGLEIIQNTLKNSKTTYSTFPNEMIKSIPNFDVIFFGPNAPYHICWDSDSDNDGAIRKMFSEKKNAVFNGFKSIELIPSP